MSLSRSPSPPAITRHAPTTLLPTSLPTPAMVRSVAEAAHYSGPVRRPSHGDRVRASFGRGLSDEDLTAGRRRVLDDLKELFCSRPTLEILSARGEQTQFSRIHSQNALVTRSTHRNGLPCPRFFHNPKHFHRACCRRQRTLINLSTRKHSGTRCAFLEPKR
ncbi:hypothetical protein JB92DRAFT_1857248 [Gautieria morchelliformis]|nr:hypothetical protein JB92DRAFT_1857248 [Gautieria morchelliformis]